MRLTDLSSALVLAAVFCATAANAGITAPCAKNGERECPHRIPDGKGGWGVNPDGPTGEAKHGGGGGGGGGVVNGIINHGGPIMLGTVGIYYIWYGNWSGNTAPAILTDLAYDIGGSPYFNINTHYYQYLNGANRFISGVVEYRGSTDDNYSFGTVLSDADILQVVRNAIDSGRLPLDADAVYFVIASKDVTASSGFCSNYCGWHNYAPFGVTGTTDIKYSFIGNPERCPRDCLWFNTKNSPNDNIGADGMASIIAHELEEAVTDPKFDAWYDTSSLENADKCAWKFGTTYTSPNGAKANMRLGSRDYLIQQNWLIGFGDGHCALSEQ